MWLWEYRAVRCLHQTHIQLQLVNHASLWDFLWNHCVPSRPVCSSTASGDKLKAQAKLDNSTVPYKKPVGKLCSTKPWIWGKTCSRTMPCSPKYHKVVIHNIRASHLFFFFCLRAQTSASTWVSPKAGLMKGQPQACDARQSVTAISTAGTGRPTHRLNLRFCHF